MKKWLIILTCCCCIQLGRSQDDLYEMSVEQLEVLQDAFKPKADTLIPIWNELAFKLYEASRYAPAIVYADKALALADDLRDTVSQSYAYMVLGHTARETGQFAAAKEYYLQAFNIRKQVENYLGAAVCLNALGVLCLDDKSHYADGVSYLQRAINLLDQANEAQEDINYLATDFYVNLGDLYCRSGDFDAAVDAFAKAEQSANESQLFDLHLNAGGCFSDTKFHQSARDRLQQALEMATDDGQLAKANFQLSVLSIEAGQLDAALSFWAKAQELRAMLDATENVQLIKNRASIHKEKGEYDAALALYQEALMKFDSLGNNAELVKLHYDMGNIHYDRKQYGAAIAHLNRSKELLAKVDMPEMAIPLTVFLSAASEQRSLQLIGFLLLGILMLVIIVAIGLIIANRQKRKIAQLQMWQTEQRLDNALQELEVERNFQHLEASEKVLNWVAKELHDRLGSMLSTIKLYLDNLNQEIHIVKAENRAQFEKANTLLDEVCEEVRRISRGAEPANLPDRGLVKEVEHMLRMIQESQQIEVEFIPHGMNQRLDSTKERKLFRMIGILVNNILMHAEATWFSLQINHFVDHLNIMVEDNGKGFDPEDVMKKGGTGLKHLYALSAELGGNIAFDREMKKGTAVTIEIPLKRNAFSEEEAVKKEMT